MGPVFSLLKDSFFATLRYDPTPDLLTGRTVVVTGANVGLGLETAVHLGRLDPAKLILACRTASKGEAARLEVAARSGLAVERVEVWALDLAEFASVNAFAAKANTLDRLDILCQNAGVFSTEWRETGDGWETQLQVNGLATGQLGVMTLPLVARTAALPREPGMKPFTPHSTIVGSEIHGWTTNYKRPAPGIPLLANLNDPNAKNAPIADRYPFTKLISLFLAREISQLGLAKEVVVNVVNPGLCVSALRSKLDGSLQGRMLDRLAFSAEDGAKNIALGCIATTKPGGFVSYTRLEEPTSPFSKSEEGLLLEHDLWEEMAQEWVKIAPEVNEVLA